MDQKSPIIIDEFNGVKIAVKGVAKLFYQEGIPLELIWDILKDKGVQVSWLHVADQLLKNGWSSIRVKHTIEPILMNTMYETTLSLVYRFLEVSYEQQRQMIFNSLFEDEEMAKKWLREKIH